MDFFLSVGFCVVASFEPNEILHRNEILEVQALQIAAIAYDAGNLQGLYLFYLFAVPVAGHLDERLLSCSIWFSRVP